MARLVLYEHKGRDLLGVDKATINGLEAAIRWAEVEVPKQARQETWKLARTMALVNQMFARRMSFGPHDPWQRQPEEAWRMPSAGIRRITENYYFGWQVKYSGPGWWTLYNNSREAYFIEFGIHTSNRRVRRPVRKLSQLKTLRYMMTTQAYHRVWSDIYMGPRRGKGRKIGGFTQTVQSPAGGHQRWENITGHQAVGVIKRNARKGKFSNNLRVKNGQIQQRVPNKGGGTYQGRKLGRRLP
jgi:hypothetical protein